MANSVTLEPLPGRFLRVLTGRNQNFKPDGDPRLIVSPSLTPQTSRRHSSMCNWRVTDCWWKQSSEQRCMYVSMNRGQMITQAPWSVRTVAKVISLQRRIILSPDLGGRAYYSVLNFVFCTEKWLSRTKRALTCERRVDPWRLQTFPRDGTFAASL